MYVYVLYTDTVNVLNAPDACVVPGSRISDLYSGYVHVLVCMYVCTVQVCSEVFFYFQSFVQNIEIQPDLITNATKAAKDGAKVVQAAVSDVCVCVCVCVCE